MWGGSWNRSASKMFTLAIGRYACTVSSPCHSYCLQGVSADDQFTKRACEQIGINFELRLVGQAREGMDGAGVGIGVEEAILEANEDDDVDGIMVSVLPLADLSAIQANARFTTRSTVTARTSTCSPSSRPSRTSRA